MFLNILILQYCKQQEQLISPTNDPSVLSAPIINQQGITLAVDIFKYILLDEIKRHVDLRKSDWRLFLATQ